MAESRHGVSIGIYALVLVVLVMLAFLGFAGLTYSEFQRLRSDMQTTSYAAARSEIGAVMDHLLREAETAAERFAASEEVHQQLRRPRDYPYRPNHRGQHSNLLSEMVADTEIYGQDGVALTGPDGAAMPTQIAMPAPPAYVENTREQPTLLVFRAVPGVRQGAQPEPLGYVGLRIRFLEALREGHAYHYADPQTISFTPGAESTLNWSELQSAVRFSLRENPIGEAVSELLSAAIRNLSIILGVFVLTLVPGLVLLIVRP